MNTLSLSEASGTFLGFEFAAALRSILFMLPALIFVYGVASLILQAARNNRSYYDIISYVIIFGGILAIFWPTVNVAPASIQATAAQGGRLTTASDMLPNRSAAVIPKMQQLYVQFVSRAWVDTALAINSESNRPFSEARPLSWMWSHTLNADTVKAIQTWTKACIVPAKERLLERGGPITAADLEPFPGSALYGEFNNITVRLADVTYLGFASTTSTQPCSQFASTIFNGVQAEMSSLAASGGTSLVQIWNTEVPGLDSVEISKMMIQREVTRMQGAIVQSPGLLGIYGTVRGARAIAGGISNILGGIASLDLGQALSGLGSAATGGATDFLADLTLAMQKMAGRAVFITEYSPDIIGFLMLAINAVYPIIVAWAMVPGQHVRPLATYAMIVAVIYAAPVAWAAVDLMGETALNNLTTSFQYSNPMAFVQAAASYFVIVTLGSWIILPAMAFAILIPIAGPSVVRGIRG